MSDSMETKFLSVNTPDTTPLKNEDSTTPVVVEAVSELVDWPEPELCSFGYYDQSRPRL